MNDKIPKVSVIIAVYNNKEYLPEAIHSALCQDYVNSDIWIVDDASTEVLDIRNESENNPWDHLNLPIRDEEVEVVKSYNRTGKQIFYIRLKKNSGPSVARNIAISNAMLAGSHLFQILDSDDQMYPTKISELIKPILLDPERIAVSYADYNIVNEQGIVHYESKPTYDYIRFFEGDCHIHSGALWNGLALKPFYPNFYPEHLRVTEDYYMARRVLKNGQWLAYHIAKPLTLVRSHSNDSTNSVKKEIWEENYRRTMTET